MIQIKGPIPITIRFSFWITAAIIGFINSFSLFGTLIWIGIIFVSIFAIHSERIRFIWRC